MKQNLIILHGALGSSQQFIELSNKLSKDYSVHLLEFSGHGSKEFEPEFSIEQFSRELFTYLNDKKIERPVVFGFSMGGYVAIHTALNYKVQYQRLITLGTKFDWNPKSAKNEVKYLNPDTIVEKVPKFAKILEERHLNWKHLLLRTQKLMLRLGENPLLKSEDLSDLNFQIKILRGENDNMVTEKESREMSICKNVSYNTLTATEHPIEKVDLDKLSTIIRHA